jgi:hypothetical protein
MWVSSDLPRRYISEKEEQVKDRILMRFVFIKE